jgi:polyphosphate kinase 2
MAKGKKNAKAKDSASSPSPSPLPETGQANGAAAKRRGLSKQDYEDALEPLEVQLNRMARWVQTTGQRVVVVFEGRDTAGKGGVISAISDCLNPRQCHVVALSKPTDRERTQWYYQRYIPHLPAAGEIVLFDRSWYNRAGVEAVMGFCKPEETQAFLKQTPAFEKLLTDDGIRLYKYWLTVDQAEQEARFAERLAEPTKRWKLSPIDLQARTKYAAYTEARQAMLEATHSKHAPWTLVDFNDQRRGRLKLIRHLLDRLPDTAVPDEAFAFPPLPGKPLKERFEGRWKPI